MFRDDLIDSTPEAHYAGRVEDRVPFKSGWRFFVTVDKNGSHSSH